GCRAPRPHGARIWRFGRRPDSGRAGRAAVRSTTLVKGSAPGARPGLAHRSWLDRHEKTLFILLPALVVLVLSIFPLIASLGLSFVVWNIGDRNAGIRFAGLYNWARLFSDNHFLTVA